MTTAYEKLFPEICPWRPVLVTMPFLWEYTKQAEDNSTGFFEGYYAQINEIVKETGVEYYDYSRDERFIYEPTLYFDIDHLNHDGSVLFTEDLLNRLLRDRGVDF